MLRDFYHQLYYLIHDPVFSIYICARDRFVRLFSIKICKSFHEGLKILVKMIFKSLFTIDIYIRLTGALRILPRWMVVSNGLKIHLQEFVFSSFHTDLINSVLHVRELDTRRKPNEKSFCEFNLHGAIPWQEYSFDGSSSKTKASIV